MSFKHPERMPPPPPHPRTDPAYTPPLWVVLVDRILLGAQVALMVVAYLVFLLWALAR